MTEPQTTSRFGTSTVAMSIYNLLAAKGSLAQPKILTELEHRGLDVLPDWQVIEALGELMKRGYVMMYEDPGGPDGGTQYDLVDPERRPVMKRDLSDAVEKGGVRSGGWNGWTVRGVKGPLPIEQAIGTITVRS